MRLDKLHDELIEAFIRYQWNLDNPFPSFPTKQELIIKYRTDSNFYAKVNQLTSGVMSIVAKHVKD